MLEVAHAGGLRAAAIDRGQAANAARRRGVNRGRKAGGRGPGRRRQVVRHLGGQARAITLRDAQVAPVGEAWALLRGGRHPGGDRLRTMRLRRVGLFVEVVVQRCRASRELTLRDALLFKILDIYADGLLLELLHGRWRLDV